MIRGALVGAGNAALLGHLPAYQQDPWLAGNVRLVAVADASSRSLEAFSALVPSARRYASAIDLLEDAELDFVDLCAPPHVRVEVIREAAMRRRHVLCEKPVATSLAEGLDVQSALEAWPVVFAPCHQYRHAPLWRAVIEEVGQGSIGDVHLAQFEALRVAADPGSPNWRQGWRERRDVAGGGVVLDIGTHYFYLLRTLFGLPTAVSARTARLATRGDGVEDTAIVVFDYPGRLVQLSLSWAAGRRENRFRLVGSRGSLESDGQALRRDGRLPRSWDFAGGMAKSEYPKWYAALFREFAEAVIEDRPSPQPLQDALDTLRCAEAVYASAAEGRSVALAEHAP